MKYKRENEYQQWRHPVPQKEKTGRTELRPSFLLFSSRLLIAEKPKRTQRAHSCEVFEVTREYWKIEWRIFLFLSNIRAPSPVTWAHFDPTSKPICQIRVRVFQFDKVSIIFLRAGVGRTQSKHSSGYTSTNYLCHRLIRWLQYKRIKSQPRGCILAVDWFSNRES